MRRSDRQTSSMGRVRAQAAALSRREFLRKAVSTGAAVVGVLTGLGSLFAGCDGDVKTSNTTATVHPGETTTSVVTTSTSTTLAVGPEKGRDIKVGLVSAVTGPLALHGKADEWWIALTAEALPDGIVCGDGRLHRLVVTRRDSRSDSEHAAQAAAYLILEARVDIILCSSGTDLVVPVAAQAEKLVCPCLCGLVQWRPFVSARGSLAQRPFTWTYAHALAVEDLAANFIAMWDRSSTNRRVGLLFADNLSGRAWADLAVGVPPAATAAGYECVFPEPYAPDSLDFGPYLSEFKKSGCEILCGAFTARQFARLWRQAREQEYQPKIVTVGDGLLFPHALEAIGSSALNVTAECLWHADWPYRDSITGLTCRELASDYMAKTGDQWTSAIAQYATYEWAVDVLKRVVDLDSRREIVQRVLTTDLDTCLGPIDFTVPVGGPVPGDGGRPAVNVCKAPVGGVQWVEGDAFGFEPRLITMGDEGLTTGGALRPMQYES